MMCLWAGGGTGCSALAKRPPSPATELSTLELLSRPAPANERYYVIFFGSQSKPRVPRYTHTWATIVKSIDCPGGPPSLEEHTISWLPSDGEIRSWQLRVKPGTNVGLHETIRQMLDTNQEIAMWGPYEAWHGLYVRFTTQKAFLESGQIGYQCVDAIGEAARQGNGCDCFHAISDMDPMFDRRRYPLRQYGQGATANIVKQVQDRPVLIQPGKTHDWLIPALGLDAYPICRETYQGISQEFSPDAIRALADQQQCQRGPLPR